MPFSDPERDRAWRRNYRRPPKPFPIGRLRALEEDIAQQRALADVEARRIGRRRAAVRLKAWIKREMDWIGLTYTRHVGADDDDD